MIERRTGTITASDFHLIHRRASKEPMVIPLKTQPSVTNKGARNVRGRLSDGWSVSAKIIDLFGGNEEVKRAESGRFSGPVSLS